MRRLQCSIASKAYSPTLEDIEVAAQSRIEWAWINASPKQLDFQRKFFHREGDIFAAVGGNRSGKSFVCGWLCFALYLRDHAKDGDLFWCVGQTLDRSIGGQQLELWKALPRWMFGKTVWDEKIGFGAHRKLVLPCLSGGKCTVEFRSADQAPSTFEQAKLTGVWIDERVTEVIYNRLIPRIVDRNGWILYSDIPEQWWQYERLAHAKPEARVVFQHFTMYDNAHNLPKDAIGKAAARMTADEQRQRIGGEFMIMEGLVYKQFIDNYKTATAGGHLIKPFEIPASWPRWRAIDYGGSAPTACSWIAVAPNETAYVYREYYQKNQSVGVNARAILDMSGNEKYRTTLIDPHAIDPPPVYYGAAKTIAVQYQEAGIPTTGWPYVNVMGEHAMVQRVKFALENFKLLIFDNCFNLRREFKSWKHKCDKEGKPLAADAYENDNNHLLDTLKGWYGTSPTFVSGSIKEVGGTDFQ